MKKHLSINEAVQSVLFTTAEDAKHILQKHFPRDRIRVEIDPRGITEIHIGKQIRWIGNI